jgi:hypothetical protein
MYVSIIDNAHNQYKVSQKLWRLKIRGSSDNKSAKSKRVDPSTFVSRPAKLYFLRTFVFVHCITSLLWREILSK